MVALGGLYGEKLALARGAHVLFRDLSFDVSAGETLSVEGPNGVGKTSLLRALAGLLEPRAGTLALRTGTGNVVAEPEERAQFVGWLGHLDGIKPQLTPHENLRFFARFLGSGDVDSALDRMGLQRVRDLPAQYLSAGQKKRLAFARLTMGERPLWLLDEPLSSLDAAARSLVGQLVAVHCATGGIAIAATHESIGVPCRHLVLGAP